jgi:phage terminase large subunit
VDIGPEPAAPQSPEQSAEAALPVIRASDFYRPFARQKEFHQCPAKYRLFGGAAGPGKTKALLWEAMRQANKTPGVDTLLLRRTFPELEASLITYFRRDVPRCFYQSYNESKHIVTWHNGSTTRFGYSASENDIYQYQGAELLFIGIDELTLFTLGQWQFLTSRNRCAIPGTTPNMAGATNPGNIGHAWVKALWVDQRPAPGMDRPGQYDPSDYAFIRATIADNPIYEHDADYLKTLNALPRHLRQAFLEGDWNVFAGQYFDLFDVRRHTARAEQLGLERWWPRWISIDWGFEHPSAVYWHAARPGGTVVTYREYVANHLSPRMLAQAIVERTSSSAKSAMSPHGLLAPDNRSMWEPGGERYAAVYLSEPDNRNTRQTERIGEIFLSPDAFAHHTSESTIADQLGEVLAQNGLPRPVPADDDRVGGWMLIYQMLQDGRWVIADHCARLIDCLPTLVRDPANVEDVQKMDGDDPADSARYGLKSRLGPGRAPIEQRVAERVSAADPTSRAIWTEKFLDEERRASRPPALPHRRWLPPR